MSKTRKDKIHREYEKTFSDGGKRKGPLRGIQAQGINTSSNTGRRHDRILIDDYLSFKDALEDK